jgi:glycosyltransferase involved in cell wall biosynthesis
LDYYRLLYKCNKATEFLTQSVKTGKLFMVISVNTRLLIPNKLDGITWFTRETLSRITRNHPEHQFLFLFDRPFSEEFIYSSNITPLYVFPPARHPFLWYYWFEHSVKNILDKYKPGLFLSPDGFLSLSSGVLSLPVIHDINFVHRPHDLPFFVRKYYNKFFHLYAKKACRIVTVSDFSRQDISKTYGIDPDRIDVVFNGSNPVYSPLTPEERNISKFTYADGKDYFVFVGHIHPRKNIINLLKAFKEFKRNSLSDMKLLIVGDTWFTPGEIKKKLLQMRSDKDIVFLGKHEPVNLRLILGGATALTYVSYFEGFGVPILEAMCCDTPVITSNRTSMPEVAGDAAIFVDPYSVDSIKNAMLEITQNPELRKQLIIKGQKQREKFSWDKTAEKMWGSIEKCVAGRP